ncbi:MAG: hypothetical protein R3C44_13565 [Chloroflexota bacterium]
MESPAFILIAALIPINAEKRKKEEIRSSRLSTRGLAALREDPGNIKLREAALSLGRQYVALARDSKITLFDEVALMNDLNAIEISKLPQIIQVKEQASITDINSRLSKLNELFNSGIITRRVPLESKRATILDEI